MSGGYFDYTEINIQILANSVRHLIDNMCHDGKLVSHSGREVKLVDGGVVMSKLKLCLGALLEANVYVTQLDYLISGDISEEEFLRNIDEDISNVNRSMYELGGKMHKNNKECDYDD